MKGCPWNDLNSIMTSELHVWIEVKKTILGSPVQNLTQCISILLLKLQALFCTLLDFTGNFNHPNIFLRDNTVGYKVCLEESHGIKPLREGPKKIYHHFQAQELFVSKTRQKIPGRLYGWSRNSWPDSNKKKDIDKGWKQGQVTWQEIERHSLSMQH